MNKKILPDYYPVYKEVNESPAMLNAEELADLALEHGYSTFQTVILLVKNAFEGHAYLNYQIRPEQLFNQGTILFQAKPELMILSFYEHFSQYQAGLNQIWKILQERKEDLAEINFESLVHSVIVNHLIRFPVSIFSNYTLQAFKDLPALNKQAMDQRFELVLLGERLLGEYEFIERVNMLYAEKFKEFGQQLRLKEEAVTHFQRKLSLSINPNIHSEEELEELMYKLLIDEKVNCSPLNAKKFKYEIPTSSKESSGMHNIRNMTKIHYRNVSKNCFEVHTSLDGEKSLTELNQIFLEANAVYNEPVSTMADAFLQHIQMIQLLCKVIIFRKTRGFVLAANLQLISENGGEKVLIPKDDFSVIRKTLDDKLLTYRMKSFTDYKMKFVMDDEFTDIHKHFLQKQMDFIDEQIVQMQSDIKEVLRFKSQVPSFNPDKN